MLRFALLIVSLIATALASFGCGSIERSLGLKRGATTQQVDVFGGYRISDGVVEAVIVPELRRVSSFNRVGEPNLLYWYTQRKNPPTLFGSYLNFGGEKVWLWPQNDWVDDGKDYDWPPPDDAGTSTPPMRVIRADGRRLVVETHPLSISGATVRREYRIERGRLVIDSTLIPGRAPGTDGRGVEGFGLWSVVQTRRPTSILARALPGKTVDDLNLQGLPHATATRPVNARVISIDPGQPDQGRKAGFDSDRLAALIPFPEIGPRLLVVEAQSAGKNPTTPGEAAQVYTHPLPPPDTDADDYVELEFAAPRTLPGNAPSTLRLVLSIHDAADEADAARIIDEPRLDRVR